MPQVQGPLGLPPLAKGAGEGSGEAGTDVSAGGGFRKGGGTEGGGEA